MSEEQDRMSDAEEIAALYPDAPRLRDDIQSAIDRALAEAEDLLLLAGQALQVSDPAIRLMEDWERDRAEFMLRLADRAAIQGKRQEVGYECPHCNGDGYTSEHSLDPQAHDCEMGCNPGYCPVQVQCEKCLGSGRAPRPEPRQRDEYHTMDELYEHRMALNAALVNTVPARCEKAKLHNDGTMFEDGYFIVVIKTPEGPVSYHYKMEYWDNFKCSEAERSSIPYDGHTPADCIPRLLSLIPTEPRQTAGEVEALGDGLAACTALLDRIHKVLYGKSCETSVTSSEILQTSARARRLLSPRYIRAEISDLKEDQLRDLLLCLHEVDPDVPGSMRPREFALMHWQVNAICNTYRTLLARKGE